MFWESFYGLSLALHNVFRWLILILGILAIVRAYLGWSGKREWTERDRKVVPPPFPRGMA